MRSPNLSFLSKRMKLKCPKFSLDSLGSDKPVIRRNYSCICDSDVQAKEFWFASDWLPMTLLQSVSNHYFPVQPNWLPSGRLRAYRSTTPAFLLVYIHMPVSNSKQNEMYCGSMPALTIRHSSEWFSDETTHELYMTLRKFCAFRPRIGHCQPGVATSCSQSYCAEDRQTRIARAKDGRTRLQGSISRCRSIEEPGRRRAQ